MHEGKPLKQQKSAKRRFAADLRSVLVRRWGTVFERRYDDLDLRRLVKSGIVQKTREGHLVAESRIDPITGMRVKGRLFYLEDSFSCLEERIMHLLEAAHGVEHGRLPAEEKIRLLIALDYELSVCRDLYAGLHPAFECEDVVFLSPEQIDEALQDAFAPGALWDYLMEGMEGVLGYLKAAQDVLRRADPILLHELSR